MNIFYPEDNQSCSKCGKELHEMSKEVRRELKDIPAPVTFIDTTNLDFLDTYLPGQQVCQITAENLKTNDITAPIFFEGGGYLTLTFIDINENIDYLSDLNLFKVFSDDFFGLDDANWVTIQIEYSLYEKLIAYSNSLKGFPGKLKGTYWRMLYLSMVMITALGFGDIVSLTNIARILVGIESVPGVIIIGWLINSQITKKSGKR